jgi:hypothetical protein
MISLLVGYSQPVFEAITMPKETNGDQSGTSLVIGSYFLRHLQILAQWGA